MATEHEIRQRVEAYDRPYQDLVVLIIAEFQRREGVDLSSDIMALIRVHEAARTVGHRLNTHVALPIEIPYVARTPDGPKHLKMILRRRKKGQQDGRSV